MTFGEAQEGVIRARRLGSEHVQSRAPQLARPQSIDQRRIVDRGAGCVDEECALSYEPERRH